MTDKERGRILEEALLAGSMEVDKGETASYIPELSGQISMIWEFVSIRGTRNL